MSRDLPARLLVVTDRHGSDRPLTETVQACLDGGARWFWLRDRDLDPQSRRDLALELIPLVRAAGGTLTVGGDATLAEDIDADGLHSSMDRLAPGAGPSRLVGASAHGREDIRRAAEAGADYVTLSPVFSTASKPGYGPALGLSALGEAAGLGVPVVALGGIDPERAGECLRRGAAGVAVMGALMRASDPAAAARRFVEALAEAT